MNEEKQVDSSEQTEEQKAASAPLCNRVLICGALIFLIGCAGAKTQEPSPSTPPPAQTPTALTSPPVPSSMPPKKDMQVKLDAQPKSLTCKRDNDVRVLEVEPIEPKGCKLWYSRFGTKSSVASSEKSTDHCESVQVRMQKSLEIVKFKCTIGSISENVVPTTSAGTSAPTTEINKSPVTTSTTVPITTTTLKK